MTAATEEQVAEYAEGLVDLIVSELDARPDERYDHMAEIRNLEGEVTGFAKVWIADGIRKISHLSINIMPGARYFNIMVSPDDRLDVPRFAHEGMVTVQGSQVSTDMYHDKDMAANIRELVETLAPVTAIFDEAKASGITFVPSRQVHMRAFCSPHFLNVFGAGGNELPQLEDYARRYFAEWLALFRKAPELPEAAAKERERRRVHMSDTVIALDPDRNLVVQVYGEETVAAIEQAVMY